MHLKTSLAVVLRFDGWGEGGQWPYPDTHGHKEPTGPLTRGDEGSRGEEPRMVPRCLASEPGRMELPLTKG